MVIFTKCLRIRVKCRVCRVALGLKNQAQVLGQAAESLAELPQLLGHSVVSGLRLDARQRCTVGEVVAAEVLDAFLQGTVERGLSSGLSIHEEKEDDGGQEQVPPEAGVSADFCFYGSWTGKRKNNQKGQVTISLILEDNFCQKRLNVTKMGKISFSIKIGIH